MKLELSLGNVVEQYHLNGTYCHSSLKERLPSEREKREKERERSREREGEGEREREREREREKGAINFVVKLPSV